MDGINPTCQPFTRMTAAQSALRPDVAVVLPVVAERHIFRGSMAGAECVNLVFNTSGDSARGIQTNSTIQGEVRRGSQVTWP